MYDHLNGHPLPAEMAEVKLDLLPLTQDLVPQFEADFPGRRPGLRLQGAVADLHAGRGAAVFEMQYSNATN
jgi:hypothetical protein